MEQQNNPSQNVLKFYLLPDSDAFSLALKSRARHSKLIKRGYLYKDPYGAQHAEKRQRCTRNIKQIQFLYI